MQVRIWVRWAALSLALLLLNFSLTFANLWPTPWIQPQAAVGIELAVAVLLTAIAVWRFGLLSRRALGLLSFAFVVLAPPATSVLAAAALALLLFSFAADVAWLRRHSGERHP